MTTFVPGMPGTGVRLVRKVSVRLALGSGPPTIWAEAAAAEAAPSQSAAEQGAAEQGAAEQGGTVVP
jgi:hypothetical protein